MTKYTWFYLKTDRIQKGSTAAYGSVKKSQETAPKRKSVSYIHLLYLLINPRAFIKISAFDLTLY